MPPRGKKAGGTGNPALYGPSLLRLVESLQRPAAKEPERKTSLCKTPHTFGDDDCVWGRDCLEAGGKHGGHPRNGRTTAGFGILQNHLGGRNSDADMKLLPPGFDCHLAAGANNFKPGLYRGSGAVFCRNGMAEEGYRAVSESLRDPPAFGAHRVAATALEAGGHLLIFLQVGVREKCSRFNEIEKESGDFPSLGEP